MREKRERLKAEEEKLKKLEAQQSSKGKGRKDAAAARAAVAQPKWDSDSNESESDYSVCVTRTLDSTSLAPLPLLTCAVAFRRTSQGCVNSGSQVNITPHLQHVIEFEEGEVNVSGIHRDPVQVPHIKMGVRTVTTDAPHC